MTLDTTQNESLLPTPLSPTLWPSTPRGRGSSALWRVDSVSCRRRLSGGVSAAARDAGNRWSIGTLARRGKCSAPCLVSAWVVQPESRTDLVMRVLSTDAGWPVRIEGRRRGTVPRLSGPGWGPTHPVGECEVQLSCNVISRRMFRDRVRFTCKSY